MPMRSKSNLYNQVHLWPLPAEGSSAVGETSASTYLPEVLARACLKYEAFYELEPGEASAELIDETTSLTVAGWAEADVRDWADIDAEKVEFERVQTEQQQRKQCWAFGVDNVDPATEHNEQVAKLISALGDSSAGRRAILKAVAERQGIDDPDIVEDMLHNRSDQKIDVPVGLRGALSEIGLGHTMLPINLMLVKEQGLDQVLMANDAWEDIEFEVALDSGSVVHVCAPGDCPGYMLQESPGSKRGQEFQMGDGGLIKNLGQKQLNLSDSMIGRDVQSVFQIAAVTRPLMSVGRICDEGHEITFNNICAVVRTKEGEELCRFSREPGGLYVAKLKLRSPAGFAGQE